MFDDVLKDITIKKENKEQGIFNGVPFPISSYSQYFSSFNKGAYIGILGGTGTGKSKFKRWLFYNMLDFSYANNYPIKILDFSLEDDRIKVFKKIIAHYIYKFEGLSASTNFIDSKENPLTDKYYKAIIKYESFFKKLQNDWYIINSSTSPNQILASANKVHKSFGESHHIFACVDNYSNVTRDSEDKDEWTAIRRLSRNIGRLELCKNKNMTFMGIFQMDADTEKNAFRTAAKGTIASIEPNLASIGDAKVV
jgi:hypothetical protein